MEDDGDDKDDCKRRTRNLSEKKRRDQFNMLVNELSTMVGTKGRKMDKSTVLKSTISFLREHNETAVRSRAHDVHVDWKPSFLSNEEFTFITLEGLEGFVMVFSATGRIYYVSESITSLLGHNPADIVNKSIFDLSLEDDRPRLYSLLQSPGNAVDPMHLIKKDNQFWFQCQLRRGNLDFRDEITYERVQINGHFSEGSKLERGDMDDMIFQQENESRLLFVCTGRLQTPQLIRDVSLTDFERNEFTSRHSLEWKFLFLDHRAPPIIGYLPFEVLGTSGYDYYHFDDLEKVIMCHEALMEKGEMTSCYYRFLTKGQQWIWLQTRYYITYHQWNSKPEFVVCTHRVVSYVDITKSMKQESVDETPSDAEINSGAIQEAPPEEMAPLSPTYAPGAAFVNYQPISQPPSSVNSASASSTTGTVATTCTAATTGASWAQNSSHARYAGTVGSETASMSGESEAIKVVEPALVPQHGIGAQYLDPAPYASMPAVLISHDQAQIQEQLQRKHEELQDMIARQQEELRQVKEQLMLARLGLLQPLIDVPRSYLDPEVRPPRLPAELILFETQRLEQESDYPPLPSPPPEVPQQAQPHPPQPHQPQSHQLQSHQPQSHQSQSDQPQPHQTQHHQPQPYQTQQHQRQLHQSQPPQPQSHQPKPHQTLFHQTQPHQSQAHEPQSHQPQPHQLQSHQPQPHQTQLPQPQAHQPQPHQPQPNQPQLHQPKPQQPLPHQPQPHQPQPPQ